MLDRTNRKFLLFLSQHNRLWREYEADKVKSNPGFQLNVPDAIDSLFGEGRHRLMSNWSKTPNVDPQVSLASISARIKERLGIEEEGNLFDPERFTSRKVGALLGFSHDACTYIFDRAYAELDGAPVLCAYDKATAGDIVGFVGGIYLLYGASLDRQDAFVATLDIRHPIPDRRIRSKQKVYHVKCKLNAPALDGELDTQRTFFEYDGSVLYDQGAMSLSLHSRPQFGRSLHLVLQLQRDKRRIAPDREVRDGHLLSLGGHGFQAGAYRVSAERKMVRAPVLKLESQLPQLVDDREDEKRRLLYDMPAHVSSEEIAHILPPPTISPTPRGESGKGNAKSGDGA